MSTSKPNVAILNVYIGIAGSNVSRFGAAAVFSRIIDDAGEVLDLVPASSSHTTVNSFALKETVNSLCKLASVADSNHPMITTVYVNNLYVTDGFNKWMKNWERNDWKTKTGGFVKQREVWEELRELVAKCNATINYHSVGMVEVNDTDRAMAVVIAGASRRLTGSTISGKKITGMWVDELDDYDAYAPGVICNNAPKASPAEPLPLLPGQGMW